MRTPIKRKIAGPTNEGMIRVEHQKGEKDSLQGSPSCQLSRNRINLPKNGENGRSLKTPYDEKKQFWPKKCKFEQIFQKEPKNRLFLKLHKPLYIGGLGRKKDHLECLRIASIKLSCPVARATQKTTASPSGAIDPLEDAKIDRLPFRTIYLVLDSLQTKPQKTTAAHPEGRTAAEHTRNNKHLLQISNVGRGLVHSERLRASHHPIRQARNHSFRE